MTQRAERKKLLWQELGKIVEVLKAKYKPEKIILFGSLARGEIKEWTDIDLVIIKQTNKDPWQRTKEVDKFIKHTLPVDLLIYTPREVKERLSMNDFFVKEFIEKGKVVYEST